MIDTAESEWAQGFRAGYRHGQTDAHRFLLESKVEEGEWALAQLAQPDLPYDWHRHSYKHGTAALIKALDERARQGEQPTTADDAAS